MSAEFSTHTVLENESQEFFSHSTDPDGEIVSHEWDFGDGTTKTGETVTHAYDSVGTYTVTLTVTDDQGANSTTRTEVTVEESNLSGVGRRRSPTGT